MSRKKAPTIEIYPMVNTPDGGSTIFERCGDNDPDFFDVIVRYEGDDPLEEAEDLKTFQEAWAAAERFQQQFPGAQIEEINV